MITLGKEASHVTLQTKANATLEVRVRRAGYPPAVISDRITSSHRDLLTWYAGLAGSGLLLLLPPLKAPVRALPTTWPTAEPTATPAAVVAIWAMSPGPWD